MQIILAPMEGVIDHIMRDLLTEIGGITGCVTEFIRVTDCLLPKSVFYRYCPELLQSSKTPAGIPVTVQLLGNDPALLAENAAFAAQLGAPGIDLNFGCPAKIVNRHYGGARLLEDPELIYSIVAAVRAAVPNSIPVSAKIRLGYTDTSLAIDNALAIEAAGANEITVHARTKADGYKPPAYWDWIGRIHEQLQINVIANGEIWSLADYDRCRQQSGCADIMLGRGLIRYPDLALQIASQKTAASDDKTERSLNIFTLLVNFFNRAQQEKSERYLCDRTKQWTSLLGLGDARAMDLFHRIKTETQAQAIFNQLLSAQKVYA